MKQTETAILREFSSVCELNNARESILWPGYGNILNKEVLLKKRSTEHCPKMVYRNIDWQLCSNWYHWGGTIALQSVGSTVGSWLYTFWWNAKCLEYKLFWLWWRVSPERFYKKARVKKVRMWLPKYSFRFAAQTLIYSLWVFPTKIYINLSLEIKIIVIVRKLCRS